MTVTLTLSPTPSVLLRPAAAKQTPQAFLQEALKHPLFTTEDRVLIMDLLKDITPENAIITLTLFHSDVLEPAILRTESPELLALEDAFKEVLQGLMPGIDIDSFLEEQVRLNDYEQSLLRTVEKMEVLFQTKLLEICQLADTICDSIDQSHEAQKTRQLKLIGLIGRINNDFNDRSNGQNDKINKLADQLAALSKELQQISQGALTNNENFKENLRKCRELCGKIKR